MRRSRYTGTGKVGWYAAGALTGGVAILIAFLAIPFSPKQQRQWAGQVAVAPSPTSFGQTGGQITSNNQGTYGGTAGNQWIALGPLQQGVDPAQADVLLEESVDPDYPAFTHNSYEVSVGDIVSLTFRNDSDPKFNFYHTWVLARPGSVSRVGLAAAKAGPRRGWIPHDPDVLAHTQLLAPGESDTIYFRTPSRPGDYPFFCTFPGHFQIMRGVLHVKAKG